MIKNNKNSLQPKLKDQIQQATSHKVCLHKVILNIYIVLLYINESFIMFILYDYNVKELFIVDLQPKRLTKA